MNFCFLVFGNFSAYWKERESEKYGRFQNRLTLFNVFNFFFQRERDLKHVSASSGGAEGKERES